MPGSSGASGFSVSAGDNRESGRGAGGGGRDAAAPNDDINDKIDQRLRDLLNKALEKSKKCDALAARSVGGGNELAGWAQRDPVANAQLANYLFNAFAWVEAGIVSRFSPPAGAVAGGDAAFSGLRVSDYVNVNIAKYQADLQECGLK